MPRRNSIGDQIVRAASKCLKLACAHAYKSVEIGTVAQVVSGGTPSTADPTMWDGEIVWVTPKDLGRPRTIEISNSERRVTEVALGRSATRILPKGTVLLSSRAPIGHVAIAAVPLCSNQGFKNLIASDKVNNRYLFHMLRASIEELESLGRGNTFKEIPARVVQEYKLPLPPIDVQVSVATLLDLLYRRQNGDPVALPNLPEVLHSHRNVVLRIEELAGKIEEARGLRRQAIQEAQALLSSITAQLFSTGVSDDWTIGKLGDYVVDDCYGTSEKTNDDTSGTPILRMGNLQHGRLDIRNLKYLHLGESEREKLSLRKGDILVNRTNSAELVGKCAVFEAEGEYSFASYLIRLRLDTDRADPRLVAAYINSPAGRAYMFAERKQMTGQANVNATKLKALPLALPALEEQRRIVSYLDSLQDKIDTLKQLQAETSRELDAMLPAVLERAFSGQLK